MLATLFLPLIFELHIFSNPFSVKYFPLLRQVFSFKWSYSYTEKRQQTKKITVTNINMSNRKFLLSNIDNGFAQVFCYVKDFKLHSC